MTTGLGIPLFQETSIYDYITYTYTYVLHDCSQHHKYKGGKLMNQEAKGHVFCPCGYHVPIIGLEQPCLVVSLGWDIHGWKLKSRTICSWNTNWFLHKCWKNWWENTTNYPDLVKSRKTETLLISVVFPRLSRPCNLSWWVKKGTPVLLECDSPLYEG